ncbi:unnamed protein product [Urochloa decumbens]|uniref:Peroxidase n=1 Tax=Urochloa decumbens TaxID=240449 RepID=A0ABC9GZ63_9POAL
MGGVLLLHAAAGLLLLAAAAAVSARPVSTLLAAGNETKTSSNGGLSVYFHLDSCPQLETIVRSNVDAALRQNVRLTAGLLRLFFHDCFPQGCDASILLDNGERNLAPNVGLQQEVLQLIDDIRANVHAQCGPTVSCADITVLATRDAVNLAGGPAFTVPLGRLDSLAPASDNDVFKLPPPTATVDELLSAFTNAGLADPADLVSLSGAHTVGKARCSAFGAVDGQGADVDMITKCVTETCSAASGSGDRLRDLDFLTPTALDNLYFVELTLNKNKGVMLPSDQGLATDPRTSWLVQGFADNHWWFFDQFSTSMIKMSQLRGPQANLGEVRRSCSTRNPSGGLPVATA